MGTPIRSGEKLDYTKFIYYVKKGKGGRPIIYKAKRRGAKGVRSDTGRVHRSARRNYRARTTSRAGIGGADLYNGGDY